MRHPHLHRARQLLAIRRPMDASRALLEHLAEQPEDPDALALLAFASIECQQLDVAIEHARAAVRAGPDHPLAWHALGTASLRRGRPKDAEAAARRVVELDPGDADGFGLYGAVLISTHRWAEALDVADQGLAVDPEHDGCTNVRAMALCNLGRPADAERTLEGQLQRRPDDAHTHANQGWTLLRQGEHERARDHFRAALRLDPSLDWARHGLREALKARHRLYRPLLRGLLWIGALPPRTQTVLLIGGYFGFRVVSGLARDGSPLAPLWYALIAAYAAFVILTWFAMPIANGLLALHPDGRLTLSPRERVEAWTICAMLGSGVALLAVGWFATPSLIAPGLVLTLLCLPLRQAFDFESAPGRRRMFGFSAICAVLGLVLVVDAVRGEPERRALEPLIAEARRLEVERAELRPLWDPLTPAVRADDDHADLRVRVARLREAIEAHEARASEADAASRVTALENAGQRRATLLAALAILCFWISQFLASWLRRRHES